MNKPIKVVTRIITKVPTHEELVRDINKYLKDNDMYGSTFGEKYLKDSGAVSRINNGADPRLSKVLKIYRIIGNATST